MKQERRKVLEMLADGFINSQEAQLLLDTLNEIQMEQQQEQEDSLFDFSLDLRGIKMLAQEYGRFSIPTPTSPHIPYFSWQAV